MRGDQRFAVEGDGEAVPLGLERQRVPLVRRDLGIGTGKLFALAFDHPIKSHIVFERVRTGDIVIVRRQQTQSDAAGLVDRPRYGFEPHRDFEVLTREGLVDRQREPVIGAILAYLRNRTALRRRRIADDGPLAARTLASAPEGEVLRLPAGLHRRGVDLNRCILSKGKSRHEHASDNHCDEMPRHGVTTPDKSRRIPAAEHAASVWMMPVLNRKIATSAAADKVTAQWLTLANTGTSKKKP